MRAVPNGDDHMAIGHLKYLVGDNIRMLISTSRRDVSGKKTIRPFIHEHGHLTVDQSKIDMLSFAGFV